MRRDAHVPRVSRCSVLRQNPRKLYGKPALVSSLSRLAGLLGGGGSPERTGLYPFPCVSGKNREITAIMGDDWVVGHAKTFRIPEG